MSAEPASLPQGISPLLDRDRIARRLQELAADIARDISPAERPIAIVVLQGGFIFAADLLRQLPAEYEVDVAFMRCQSYGSSTSSSGKVLLLQDLDSEIDLRGRTALLIDDILDTGNTIRFLADHLIRRGAARVCLCVLLTRSASSHSQAIKPDFAGFEIGSEFVVGYGLDYAGRYRHLPDLAALILSPENKA
jgi:hypoxanthine phosphoribosyltransferase